MKKTGILCLILVLLMFLPACSEVEENAQPAQNIWASEGRPYKQSGVNMPGNYISVFAHGADFYANIVNIGISEQNSYELCKNGNETIYSPENAYIACASCNDNGIWIVETEKTQNGATETLKQLSYDGKVERSFALSDIANFENSVYSIRCTSDTVYLKSPDKIAAVDGAVSTVSEYAVNGDSVLVIGNDDVAYTANYTGTGTEVAPLEGNAGSYFTLNSTEGNIYSGNEEFFLLRATDTGLYGLNSDGSQETIIIWSDCNIALGRILGIVSLPSSKYLMLDAMGASILNPAAETDMQSRETVTLAAVSDADMNRGLAFRFNQSNSEYYIEIKDYSENGTVDTATAITRLNTDLIGGKYPDLIQLTDISPYPYINKGYLADMCALFKDDPNMSLEDVAIADQLMVNDGIYFIDRQFYMDTRVGYYSDFGDTFGWTFEQYIETEKSAPESMEMMYNTTRAGLLRGLCSRYIQTAVDWKTAICDFDNADFIAILEAVSRIRETPEPEDPRELDTTPDYVRMREGTLYTAATWIGSVRSLAIKEKEAGCRLSVIGYPTVDGRCGTDIGLGVPIGIFSQSKNISGSWAYIKYLLTVAGSSGLGMPVYSPSLQKQIDEALSENSANEVTLTQADVDRFNALLSQVKTLAVYDETILGIIESESALYYAGKKSAEETAKIIQSMVSLYIAEQG